jgi:hypothetical protein
VQISEKQKFDGEGGQFIIKATNGQLVTVVFAKTTQITSEGRLSRKLLIPTNITVGMQVRARGWRVDSNTITASLFIIQNIELNPVLSMNGVLQKMDGGSITVLSPDGQTRNFSITNETEVNVNYTLYGTDGMNSRYWYRVDIWMDNVVAMNKWGLKKNVKIEIVEMGDNVPNWKKQLAKAQ